MRLHLIVFIAIATFLVMLGRENKSKPNVILKEPRFYIQETDGMSMRLYLGDSLLAEGSIDLTNPNGQTIYVVSSEEGKLVRHTVKARFCQNSKDQFFYLNYNSTCKTSKGFGFIQINNDYFELRETNTKINFTPDQKKILDTALYWINDFSHNPELMWY